MGTNYYVKQGHKMGAHIGKTSSMGLYCYHCERSLVGYIRSPHEDHSHRLETCPNCNNKPDTRAYSFTYAIKPERLAKMTNRRFVDEYGTPHTFHDMIEKILGARFISFDSIGVDFS